MAKHKALKVQFIHSGYFHKGKLILMKSKRKESLDDWKYWRYSNEFRIPELVYRFLTLVRVGDKEIEND
jgi:hypothetical protein